MSNNPNRSSARNRHDNQPPLCVIDEVELQFDLDAEATRVQSRLTIRRQGNHSQPLRLDGEQLQLQWLRVDGVELSGDQYQLDEQSLTIATTAEALVVASAWTGFSLSST